MTTVRNKIVALFDPKSARSINTFFRERRFRFFKKAVIEAGLLEKKQLRILDIGGTPSFWQNNDFVTENMHITLLNLEEYNINNKNFKSAVGNACDMPEYKTGEFDLVFSNSVIEHLFTWENQVKMANEARRVGASYFIQTPNYYFPIEPHWIFPLFQYLPRYVRVWLTSRYSLGHIDRAKDKQHAERQVDEVRLLTRSEMKKLFPEGKVYNEKFFGLTKSIVMYHFSK